MEYLDILDENGIKQEKKSQEKRYIVKVIGTRVFIYG